MNAITLENLGTVNKNKVSFYDKSTGIAKLRLWFSYETCVGYWYNGQIVCRVNDWSNTTGKLLNEIEPDKKKRIEGTIFEKQLDEIVNNIIV